LKKDGEDEDDAPTYVVADSNETLSKTEYEALMRKENLEDETPAKANGGDEHSRARKSADGPPVLSKQYITEIGNVRKKRKAVKVVGDTEEGPESHDRPSKVLSSKPKKKAKAVKLSFGDDEHS